MSTLESSSNWCYIRISITIIKAVYCVRISFNVIILIVSVSASEKNHNIHKRAKLPLVLFKI